ncbi:tail fiber/spike domain-containing protein [Proteus mirabilis]|uniref:tail fiber/spike domain-containing protein n=1 Tax=Proteus mirabilis TaxID=584 RepID=UPI002875405E|nr:right-handed parallel beta-helix repeat-containing protein [Proteus mirabilis]MDS0823288.1 right-handed parallel beta-helix repeat-containing protein [Proteus mirabilis]
MSTIPTQNPVPSEAPRDLKFNSGKIDEFVTSMKNKYIDRFGQEHFTIEGLRWIAQQAISQFGYITLDSFQKGAEITLPNQVLRDEVTGEYYRWDGELPKIVQIDSTPDNSGGIGAGKWLSVGDTSLRNELKKPTGSDLVGYNNGTLTKYIEENNRHTAKTIINVSAFGNTGTEQNGSDEAWNNAFSYALSIAPKWKNNYPAPQEWYDFSGIEFVADGPVYPKTSIGFRGTVGGVINLTVIAPDDIENNAYLIDMSKGRGITIDRAPTQAIISGAIHCRYKCSGLNLGGSNSCSTFNLFISQFLTYGIDTDASDLSISGGHTIGPGTVVEQRSWSAGGDADFPDVVTTGTGIYIRSHDNRLIGATVSYCKLRCVRIRGFSNRLISGTHLYSGGKQAILHEATSSVNSGNTLIDSCWLDSARVQLDGSNITVTNNLIYLTQGTDSELGIVCGGNATNIRISNNLFTGWTGGIPVYFGKGALADKTVVSYGNHFTPGMTNTDVITNLVVDMVGESTAGTVTLHPSTSSTITYDGVYVNFTATIRWSSFTGGTGAIGVYGLPFVADRISIMSMQQFTNNSNFTNCTAIKHTSGTSLRFIKPDGTPVLANSSGVDNGHIVISGRYIPA